MSLDVPVPAKTSFLASSIGAFTQTLFAKIFLLAANLATGIIVARSLAPVGRGEQAAMSMWPGLLSGLFSLGLALALTYSFRREPERQIELLSASSILAICLGLVATGVGMIFLPAWLSRYDTAIITFARWMLLLIPFTMITFVQQAALEARSDFTTSNLSKSLPQLASVVILGSLALTHRLTPFSSTFGYLAPWTVVPFLLGWRLRKLMSLRFDNFRGSAKRLLSYGLRSYPIDVLGTLSGQVDQVLVVGLISASGLGLYTVALSVSRILSIFHASLVTVLFPKAAALAPAQVVALTSRITRISSLAAFLGAATLIVALPFLMVHLYGGAFRDVVPVARILCIEIVVTGATSILSQSFMATGKPGTIAVLQVIGLLLTVPFMLVLIPRYGLSGAALALLCSSTCRLLIVIACYPLILKSPVPNLMIGPSDFAYVMQRLKR